MRSNRAQQKRLLDMLRATSDVRHPPSRYRYGPALTKGRGGPEKIVSRMKKNPRACQGSGLS